jgi:hypothetical protein
MRPQRGRIPAGAPAAAVSVEPPLPSKVPPDRHNSLTMRPFSPLYGANCVVKTSPSAWASTESRGQGFLGRHQASGGRALIRRSGDRIDEAI